MEAIPVSPRESDARSPGRTRLRRPLLGDLLMREQLVTRGELEAALEIQAREAEPRQIGEILVDQQVITRRQLNVVLDKYHRKYRLGELLVLTHAITEEQLERALAHQKRSGLRLGDALLVLGILTEEQIRRALCKQFRAAFVDLDAAAIDPDVAALIPREYAAQHRAVLVSRDDGRIRAALDDPGDLETIEELAFLTNCQIEVVTSTAAAFDRALSRAYDGPGAEAGVPAEPSGGPDAPDLRALHAEAMQALAETRAAHAALHREHERVAGLLHDLDARHAATVQRLGELESMYAALERAHEATRQALRAEPQKAEGTPGAPPERGADFDAVLRHLTPRPSRPQSR
jgi:hypothetical protein